MIVNASKLTMNSIVDIIAVGKCVFL